MESQIKRRRTELGLTLEEVGEMCGVGKSTVRKWENGMINDIGRSKIVLLAKALRVSPLFILEEDCEEKVLLKDEIIILDLYNQLNYTGKKKAKDYIIDLAKVYNKEDGTDLLAAHSKKGSNSKDIESDIQLIKNIKDNLH
jgi:transcriptional regulator with XRE-family HTH domain